MKMFRGKAVTHRNKYCATGVKFHKKDDGNFLYYSETYGKWMSSELHVNLEVV